MTSRSEHPPSRFWRARDSDGNQIVVVDERYTWAWYGTPDLRVGEHVVCPGNPWTKSRDYCGEVTALGSDYLGPVRRLRERCRPEDLPTFDQLMLW